ncbi:MAG: Kelch repeat-containing protein, partial [Planctomycetota bacterium]|jgi:hypothetical protein
MLQMNVAAGPAEGVTVTSITLSASGSGNDAMDITAVGLYVDANNNGTYEAGTDVPSLATGVYIGDNGMLPLTLSRSLAAFASEDWIVVYTFTGSLTAGTTFQVSVTAAAGTGAISAQPVTVLGLPISGGLVTVSSPGGGPRWVQINPQGNPPPARFGHTAIYDGQNNRMIVFGGWSGTNTPPFNDVWALSLTPGSEMWTPITVQGGPPTPRWGHSAALDAVNNFMVVFAGYDNSTHWADTWYMNITPGAEAWTQPMTGSIPPPPRKSHTAVFAATSTLGSRMLVFAGDNLGLVAGQYFNDLWGASITPTSLSWTQVPSLGGSMPLTPRSNHSAVFDNLGGRMIIFGGDDGSNFFNVPYQLSMTNFSWTAMNSTGAPSGRSAHTAVMDPGGNRMLVFAGQTALGSLNDLYAFNLAGSIGGMWVAINPTGGPPPARAEHTAIWDAQNGRMIVFGGRGGTTTALNDVWDFQ